MCTICLLVIFELLPLIDLLDSLALRFDLATRNLSINNLKMVYFNKPIQ